jgi:hypothetical protein
LHWLSDAGIVLWANQTELDVLGYSEEEYIGKPISKFETSYTIVVVLSSREDGHAVILVALFFEIRQLIFKVQSSCNVNDTVTLNRA